MSDLSKIFELRSYRRKRVSSYDPSGGNLDFLIIKAGEKRVIFDINGPGCIRHIWSTQAAMGAPSFPRHVIVRIWWDHEEHPSVECPLGDFFGLGHGERTNFNAGPVQMSPESGKGMNCWWPMPFQKHARIEIENDNLTSWTLDPSGKGIRRTSGMNFYYYVDYEEYDQWPPACISVPNMSIGYFHCQFRRIDYKPDMQKDPDSGKKYNIFQWQILGGKNRRDNGGYDRNHIILDAKGKGQYVGCHLDIDNRARLKVNLIPKFNWPGEGDDMIFIDEDVGREPTLYGTGTEDYVNTAYCPTQKYDSPYHGIIKGGWNPWGKLSYYRYHILDPISFEKQIKVTIEHGHNNHRGDIWESTAYWYQIEPHQPFPPFPSYSERHPRQNRILQRILSLLGLSLLLGLVWWLMP
jgi:hypothetical protein